MNRSLKLSRILASLTLLIMLGCAATDVAYAQRETSQMRSEPNSAEGLEGPSDTFRQYLNNHPDAGVTADTSYPGGMVTYGEHGETNKKVPAGMNPGVRWPELVPPFPVFGSDHTKARMQKMSETIQADNPLIGAYPLTANFAASAMAIAAQMQADVEQSPEMAIPRAKEEQNQANQTAADTNAQMERNQAGAALDFVSNYLYNFTTEANNKWNRVRNELFLPMALLLLLPGVVLAQLKATVAAGTPVINDVTSPFDGILRSIVGIFLIPATYLFINYGIDVSNSITYTIKNEYQRIFGTDMYQDAMCAHIRAFPFRNPSENLHHIPNQKAQMGPLGQGSSTNQAFRKFEGENLEVALRDPCANLDEVPRDRANEMVPYVVNAQRNSYNTVNSALAMSWNVLCAFQQAYLYYLWFVGPVIAALWVYPMKELRDAFPAWINGVVTICFWSLFWNTTILLMACCRGVDETGTLIMTALNFLTTASVKFAFDFSGLVKEAGMQAAKMAEKGGSAGGGGGGAGKQGAAGQSGAGHGSQMPGGMPHPLGAPGGPGGGGGSPEAQPALASAGDNGMFNMGTGVGGGDGSNRDIGGSGAPTDFNVGQLAGISAPPMSGFGLGSMGLSDAMSNMTSGLDGAAGSAPFFGFSVDGSGGLTPSQGPAGGPIAGDSNGDGKVDMDDIKFSFGIDPGAVSAGDVPGGAWSTSNMATTDSGAVTLGDTHHDNSSNATHHAWNINQDQMKALFADSPAAASARDQMREQLHQQMLAAAQNGSALGVTLPGGADGQGRLLTAAQFDQALAANGRGLDGQTIGGNALANAADAPGFAQAMERAKEAASSAAASNISGLGLPNMASMTNLDTSSMQAQVQAQAQAQAMASASSAMPPLSGNDGLLARQSFDPSSTGGYNGPPITPDTSYISQAAIGAGAQAASQVSDLQQQAVRGIVDQLGTAVPGVPANFAGAVDANTISGISSAAAMAAQSVRSDQVSAINAQTMADNNAAAQQAQQAAQQYQQQAGSQFLGQGGDMSGIGSGNMQSAISQAVQGQWMDKNTGFEANMLRASADEAASGIRMANEERFRATMQDQVTGQVSAIAASQAASQAAAQASNMPGPAPAPIPVNVEPASNYGSAFARASSDVPNPAMNASNIAGVNSPVADQVNQMAQALNYTPEVAAPQVRSANLEGGLAGGGSPGYENYQSSAMPNQASMSSMGSVGADATTTSSTQGYVPSSTYNVTGDSGYTANQQQAAPQFDKPSVSELVQHQWKDYDNRVEQAISSETRMQMNNAVESTSSMARQSIGENMSGVPMSNYAMPLPLPLPQHQQQMPQPQQQMPQPQQPMPQPQQPMPQPQMARQQYSGTPGILPVPVRYGTVADSRNEAIRRASNALSKDALSGPDKKGGTNKLSSALGRAASGGTGPGAGATGPAAGSLPRAMKDPLGSVASGSTLRRLRMARKQSADELDAMKKLADLGDPTAKPESKDEQEPDWQM